MGALLSQHHWSEFDPNLEEFHDGSSQVHQPLMLSLFTSPVCDCRQIFRRQSGCCSQESCADLIKPGCDG